MFLTQVQEAILQAKGYIFEGVRKLSSGEFVAEATKNSRLTAAHLGESPHIATRNLIQMLVRK